MISVLDENLIFIDGIFDYEYAQYTDNGRDFGTFNIKLQMGDKNKYLLDSSKTFFILFDFKYLYKINSVKFSYEDNIIDINGYGIKQILNKRVIKGTIKYSGKTYKLLEVIIKENILKDINSDRYIDISVKYENENDLKNSCSDINIDITGGYIWEELLKYIEQDSLCIYMYPINRLEKQIKSFEIIVTRGINRTANQTKNNPIILTSTMNMIINGEYEYNNTEETNVAFVAGEGEGTQRKWFEIQKGNQNKKGILRQELWIDARDIQSEKDDGQRITDAEYYKLITERTNEKFSESQMSEEYTANVNMNNKQYVFQKDYDISDFITIIDSVSGLELDAQIIEFTVTYSKEYNDKLIDINLSYGKIRKNQNAIEKLNKEIEYLKNNIKYLLKG